MDLRRLLMTLTSVANETRLGHDVAVEVRFEGRGANAERDRPLAFLHGLIQLRLQSQNHQFGGLRRSSRQEDREFIPSQAGNGVRGAQPLG